jgi:predicted dithiol-disulfide oxidoreductase (DUF899 family)
MFRDFGVNQEPFDGRSQLIIYHFMMARWRIWRNAPSPFAAVSRAPLSKIEEFKKRIGLAICLVSSFAPNFNYDYHTSFTKEELAKAR